MNRGTGFVGALVEAWGELRVHKTRVLLSLVGVGVAVAALTTVVAGGRIATQIQMEQYERFGGRPAMVGVSAWDPVDGRQPTTAEMEAAFASVMERYRVGSTSRVGWGGAHVRLPDGIQNVSLQLVDQPYGIMHRLRLEEGEWFTPRDANRLAPAVIVSGDLWNRMGAPDLRTHPTIELVSASGRVLAVVTGVIASPPDTGGDDLSGFMLIDAYLRVAPPEETRQLGYAFEAWVPPEIAPELMERFRRDIAGELGSGYVVDVWRNDYLAFGGDDPLLPLKLAVTGVAILVLLLGALGLLNIALVTVRHRIREIGIRRSFGATAGRIFTSVLLESVVATTVAGAIGVLVSVLLVRNPLVTGWIDAYVQDVPAFPLDAALLGLAAAVGVGALAGILPALVAVRVKVIDAIRF